MPQFEVTGVNSSGKTVKIILEGDSAKTARTKARDQGLTPLKVDAVDMTKIASGASTASAGGASTSRFSLSQMFVTISVNDIASMTRQLATLIKAHVPVVESLSALVEQLENPKLKTILMGLRQEVNEGKPLGDAFSHFPEVFNRIYVNMVKAGESSGRLDVVLLRLADLQEGQVKLKNKVTGALAYPIVMVVVGFIVLGVIFVKVVPQITKIFIDLKQNLPLATKMLIAISEFSQEYIFHVLIGILVFALMMERFLKTAKGRVWKDKNILILPIIGKIFKSLAVARFARTLGTLLNSGVPMLAALEISKNVASNAVYEDIIEIIKEQVSQGRPLAQTLKTSGAFPPIVIHMVGVGEKTGELEGMLINVATTFEEEVDVKLGALTSLLEPLMMIVMALLVGFIVIAVLLPIFEMNSFAR